MQHYWTEYDLERLTDLVFETNYSSAEIAKELDCTKKEVVTQIREIGLSWVRRNKGHASRGQAALTYIMRKLLPGEKIVTEEPIGERLRLDVYCPRYNLAAEYHGRQHFYYTPHFHGDMEGFRQSQLRDERKLEICQNLGIILVVFRFNDHLAEDVVYERLLDAIRNAPQHEEDSKESRYKGDPYYESQKERAREYRRMAYQRMKRRV